MTARLFATAAILATTAGCMSVQPVWEPAPFATPAATNARVVYVTQQSGAVVAIANPRVSEDSVHGLARGENRRVAVSLREVSSVATLRINGRRTALLLAGVTVAGSLAAVAFIQSSGGRSNWECDYNTPALDGAGAPTCGFRN